MGETSSPWAALGPVVPIPAVLIDKLLPALSDTELRVLLIVIRQTLGWVDPGHESAHGRKWRDWISQSQLKAKTGKSRDSLSRAIGTLVEADLIVVENGAGEPLTSPDSRKRARARLHYRLHERWFQGEEAA